MKNTKTNDDLNEIKTLINNLDYTKAMELLEMKFKSNPNRIEVIDLLSEVYYELDNIEGAQRLINKSITLDPEHNGEKYFIFAQFLLDTKPKVALQCYQKGISIYKNELSSTDQQQQQQLNDIKTNIASGYASIIELYMHALCEESNAEMICEDCVTEGLQYDSNSIELLLQLSNLRIIRGRDDEAKQALENINKQIDNMDSNDNEYPDHDMMVNISKNYAELNELDKAIKYMDIAIKMDDEDMEGWYYLAYYHYNMNNNDDALKCLKNINKTYTKMQKAKVQITPQISDILDAAKCLYNTITNSK